MPKFTVMRRVDAYVNSVAEIEAATPFEAAKQARDSEEKYVWEQDSTSEFDNRLFVTLDDSGNEIEGTEQGDQ